MSDDDKISEAAQILQQAEYLIIGDRAADYGPAEESFARIARLWSALLGHLVAPHEVALCLAAMKLARAAVSPGSIDNWVDMAGYSALGWQCVIGEEKEK